MPRIHFRAIALLALALVVPPVLAAGDPPARVGRLAVVENDVDFRVDRNSASTPATPNWPLSSGAILETGRSGRVEVWIGSTAYRIAGGSEVEFPVVDDSRVDVRMRNGSLTVSVLDRDQADDVEVSTPEGRIRFLTPGRYRIDVDDEHSELRVQAGRAVFDDGRQATQVTAGQRFAQGRDGDTRFDADQGFDAFDRWVASRENASVASNSRRYVSPHMTGYQDLDQWGDWRSVPEYGNVWYPRAVADDWAPYRYGRWAWVEPWGWTWIDQAPWGFAPFHYGRWVLIGGGWAWVPGRPTVRPVYAPALVGWMGDPGWRASFSFGAAPAVGWFPLAPREVYVPAYRYSPTYVRQINITHVTDVNIINRAVRDHAEPHFAYRAQPRAVTVVPADRLREGRPISPHDLARINSRERLDNVPLTSRAPTTQWLAPTRQAVRPLGEFRQETRDAPRPMERGGRDEAGRDRRHMPDGRPENWPERRGGPAPMPERNTERGIQPLVTQPAPMPRDIRPAPEVQRVQPQGRVIEPSRGSPDWERQRGEVLREQHEQPRPRPVAPMERQVRPEGIQMPQRDMQPQMPREMQRPEPRREPAHEFRPPSPPAAVAPPPREAQPMPAPLAPEQQRGRHGHDDDQRGR
jgi:hypothetical protein